jgi:hypothetical protein
LNVPHPLVSHPSNVRGHRQAEQQIHERRMAAAGPKRRRS